MRTRQCLAVLSLVVSLGLTWSLSAQRPGLRPTVFAITDARIISEPGKELPKATVVVRDGVIQAVGPDVKPPADALIIDGTGLTVYAGFIDAGSTWGVDLNLRRTEAGPPETVDYASEALAATKADNRKGIFPEFETGAALQVNEEHADAWRHQGITARLAMPDAAVLAGQSALVSLSGAPPRTAILRSPVAMHAAFRTAGDGYPRSLMGAVAHLRQTLLDAGHHARLSAAFEKDGLGRQPPRDPALVALGPVLEGKQPVIVEADSKDAIHRALDFSAEFKLRPVLYGGSDAWKAASRLSASKTPVIARLNFPDQPRGSGRRRTFGLVEPPAGAEEPERAVPKRVQEEQQRQHKEEIKNLVLLQQQGVPFALSTNGFDKDGPNKPEKFRDNLRKVIGEGLPADAALKALTIDAARILGVDKQLGTIAPGKLAHLTVMTGDLSNPKAQVKHLFADGVHFEYDVPLLKPEEKKPEEKKPDPAKPAEKEELASEIETDRKPSLRTGGNVLIRGATVLTVTKGTLKADILVQGGKIAKIGPGLQPPSQDVAVIEADGLFVMPGIIDTHCHFAMSGGVNEFSLSVVPEIRARDVVESEDVQIYRALAGGVTTARLLHGSANVIGGQDAVIKLKYGEPASKLLVADAPRGVKFALGENVKRTDGRFPNTRLGVEAVLIRAFTEAQAYKQGWDEYQKAKAERKPVPEPRRDLRLEALADILDGKIHIHCHCYRADEILMLLRVAERFHIKIKSLQHVLEGYKIAPEIAKHGASCSTFSDWWAYKIEAYDAIPFNSALLQESGALVCLKSDSSELMRHLYQEAAKLMKYGGMTETDALKTITLNAAKQLGLDKRTGSIEEGKDADLAIFNAHPLNSYARCEMTLVEGEVYFQRSNGSAKGLPNASLPPAGPRGPAIAAKKIEPNREDYYVLKNITVHPVSGPVIDKTDVFIYRGKVLKVGDDIREPWPEASPTVIDGTGLHVYPGMSDAGTVLGLTELGSAKETHDFAEGGDFQPDLRAATGINPDSELIPVTRANGVLAVVTRPSGGVIAGQSALINLSGWVPAEMVLVEPLALHIEFPTARPVFTGDPSGVNVGRILARKQRDEKIRRVKQLFKQAVAYDQARKDQNAPADPRLEALVPYAKGEKPVVIQANRHADIQEALKLADELKIKMILSGGLDAWKVADELKKRDIPVILGPVMIMPQENHDPYDAPFACAAKLHAAGVRFCIRSAGSTNTRNLPYEAAMAASYGLPQEEALKAVTLHPAHILGVADQLGSISPGKRANLVLTDGDLLQATTQVHALFINGKPLEPTSKQTRLYERYRQRLQEVKDGRAPLGTGVGGDQR